MPSDPIDELRNLGIRPILIEAPPGCGKTEALAHRADGIIHAGLLNARQQILAITFSNRARDNLAARMKAVVGPTYRDRVVVTNFHGFAARLVRAHGHQIGVDPSVRFPDRLSHAALRRDARVPREQLGQVDTVLSDVKSRPIADDQVSAELQRRHATLALRVETLRVERQVLDYDDLIRHADRLLAMPDVAKLYALHFPVVLVDELQDLTPQQFRLAAGLGMARVTAAGDRTQGIYAFAGADPVGVFAEFSTIEPTIISLSTSYRSAPQVLDVVNEISSHLGGSPLNAAHPERWTSGEENALLIADNPADEADRILSNVLSILDRNPEWSIGIVARGNARLASLAELLSNRGHEHESWSNPTHDRRVVAALRREVRNLPAGSPSTQLAALIDACRQAADPSEAHFFDDLVLAASHLDEMLIAGLSLEDAVRRCRALPPSDAPVGRGIHLLNAHLGKGQEFDWVVVVGLEQGQMPDFRADTDAKKLEELCVLHVIVSRARHGLTFSRVRAEKSWLKKPSPWMPMLERHARQEW